MSAKNIKYTHPAIILATWFGSGFIKPAPGTWGSIASLPFGFVLLYLGGLYALIPAIICIYFTGLWAADIFEKQSGNHDDKRIVIDETAGQFIALIPAALTPLHFLCAFIFFRIFDILKPWPISYIDKNVDGALGVMLDDVIAGIFAAFVLLGLRFYVPGFN